MPFQEGTSLLYTDQKLLSFVCKGLTTLKKSIFAYVVTPVYLCLFLSSVMLTAQTSGLIAGYNFNEGSGTTVGDVSGNGLTGTLNSTTWTTAGKNGNALSFNGTSSFVDL